MRHPFRGESEGEFGFRRARGVSAQVQPRSFPHLQQQYSTAINAYPTDVSDKIAVQQTIQQIINDHGRIDILFNNAGVAYQGTSDICPDHFEAMIRINLLGAFYVLHAVIPQMKKQQSGYIFNLVSRSGITARPIVGGYAASKFGLRGYSEALYKELAPLGIKVTALHPGWVNTDMTNKVKIPRNEMIQTDDIATIVDMLLRLNPFTHISDIVIEPRSVIDLNS